MKLLFVLFTFASISAFGSVSSTHCSNPTGTVFWVSGQSSKVLTLKNFASQGLVQTIPLAQAEIELSDEVELSHETTRGCFSVSSVRTYAAKALISSSAAKKILTTVICEDYSSNAASPCRPVSLKSIK